MLEKFALLKMAYVEPRFKRIFRLLARISVQ